MFSREHVPRARKEFDIVGVYGENTASDLSKFSKEVRGTFKNGQKSARKPCSTIGLLGIVLADVQLLIHAHHPCIQYSKSFCLHSSYKS